MADLVLNEEAFEKAAKEFAENSKALNDLKTQIEESVETLKKEWKTPAGEAFFAKFDNDLVHNIELYANVFEHISGNIKNAMSEYRSVFDAAKDLSGTEY